MKNQQKKKKDVFNSCLELKNKNSKSISEIRKIKRKANLKITNKISNKELKKEKNKEIIKFTKRESLFNNLIIFLIISIIFKLSFQYLTKYQDSIITLKVSESGNKKYFMLVQNQMKFG